MCTVNVVGLIDLTINIGLYTKSLVTYSNIHHMGSTVNNFFIDLNF